MSEVRCPMPECQRRIDLDAIPPVPQPPEHEPCLHYIAAWGPAHGGMAEAVLWGIDGNREFYIRNLRVVDIPVERIDTLRADLEDTARRLAYEVREPDQDARTSSAALFGDQFQRDHIAHAYAQLILGPDPTLMPGR